MTKRLKLKHLLHLQILIVLVLVLMLSALTYFGCNSIIIRHSEKTAEQMIVQAAQNVGSMAEEMRNTARGLSYIQSVQELLTSKNETRNIALYDYVNQAVNVVKDANGTIYAIHWLSAGNRKIADYTRSENGIVEVVSKKYGLPGSNIRIPFFSSAVQDNNQLYRHVYVFPVFQFNTGYTTAGYGIMVLDIRELENLVDISNMTENSVFIILDGENNVVTSNTGLEAEGGAYTEIFWREDDVGVVKTQLIYNGMKSIAQSMRIEENGWRIVSIIPEKELTGDMRNVLRAVLVFMAAGMALLVFFGNVIMKSITLPIDKIVDFLNCPETEILKNRITLPQKNEIDIIASGINRMLDRVESMTKRIVENQTTLYEARLAEQEAEVLALQSQINPHFLYNTLNCLSGIGLVNDIPEITDISVAMADIYRYAVKGDKIVLLSEEIQCIKEYMKIAEIRFGNRFEVEYDFEEVVLSLYTLRMVLQPIVENAIYHGLEPRKGAGKLILKGRILEDGNLCITVWDNGTGMTEERLNALRESIRDYEKVGLYRSEKSSIGLSNINKRLKIQFGSQYGLYVDSEEGEGTEVTLILPMLVENERSTTADQSSSTRVFSNPAKIE